MFEGKSVLVTGGAGSFGESFVRTVLERHRSRRVVVFSRDELKQLELRRRLDTPRLRTVLGDVRDRDRLVQALRGVDVVVHAAAIKQVDAAERDPGECVKTNVHGAENVVHAALRNEVERVVALSTDKAANPANLYGATKMVSDRLFVAANDLVAGRRTRFAVVRYGNFAGSRGSVVPLFRRLIEQGADALPITDRRMTRFWATVPECVEFVLAALGRMQGGEIFAPRLPSMRVVDLAAAMAPDLPLREIGMRPGERLHEVMCPAEDAPRVLEFDDHWVIRPTFAFDGLDIDHTVNAVGERGRPVPDGWSYESGGNPWFLGVDELARLNEPVSA